MKKVLPAVFLWLLSFAVSTASAQCTTGYTNCSLNWDYLSFFPSAGLGSYTNLAHSQTQRFAFGTQRLTITHDYTGSNAAGISTANTAEAGSNGAGADVQFAGNGNITVTFLNGVQNIRFSLYDIDASQRITVTSTGNTITMTEIGTNTHLTTVSGLGTGYTQASSTSVDNDDTRGTINVAITSPTAPVTSVTSFTIAVSGSASTFYLSDIAACSAGTFTSNYFQVARPFTNQPGYIVTSRNDSFYFVNPADGAAKFIFRDPTGKFANSVAYDPVRHEVYYAFSLTNADTTINANNKTLRRYNYDQDTFGTVISDITVFAPIFEQGIESGSAAFYDGSLYLGLEASASGSYESTVWKIEFSGSAGNPTIASQVYAIPGTGHDWGDIAVVNGTLVDFDSRPASANYYHQDLYTKSVTNYSVAAGSADLPRQTAVDWNNVIYNIGGSANSTNMGGIAYATGTIATYNGNGTISIASIDTIKFNGVAQMGSWGDAGEAFKPRVDYGDAPATYDPAASDPAVHEISNNLYLGSNRSDEWNSRGQTAFANSDNFDDGLAIGSLVNPTSGSFFAQVRYFNNTGTTATICAWVDFNNNGVFDASEGRTQVNLPSSASVQTVYFNWTGVVTPLTNGSYTYLRLRITTTANSMTTSNPTGYFSVGEVEDHRLMVTTFPLTTQLVNFSATKAQNKVNVKWEVTAEEAATAYTVQRSADAKNWTDLTSRMATTNRTANNYEYVDANPLKQTSYYRLKIVAGGTVYSAIQKIEFTAPVTMQLSPNPATGTTQVVIYTGKTELIELKVYNVAGRQVYQQHVQLKPGTNSLPLSVSNLAEGNYLVQVQTTSKTLTQKLMIKR